MKLLLLLFIFTIIACEEKDPCIVNIICEDYESEECDKFYKEAQKNCGK
ncbi:MAG: hypothetical protein OXM55_03585 [Bdellovibrionales bacterium]|nr:hypothetical protein [Bdellovibrionales bacterium]